MSEMTPEQPVEAEDDLVKNDVYDQAELRYIDNHPGKTAAQTRDALNEANKDPKVGRADGKRGPRYVLK